MSRDSVIIVWTTILTVVLLIWVSISRPYEGMDLSTIKAPPVVETTPEDLIKVENILR